VALIFAATVLAGAGERRRSATIAAATLGLVWIGFGAGHAVLIRELPHGGGLMLDVLLAVFVGDTAAHLFGSLYGRRRLAPTISPNKTVEGLIAGIVVGVAAAVATAAIGQPWLELGDAALIGLAAALAAPVGDLFESLVKRDAGVKDSGGLLGPHGGVLDRVDAVLFASVAAYYVAVALL
jgi:phosphatidate cytidylyltransferase